MKNPIVITPESRDLPVIKIGDEAVSLREELLDDAGSILAIFAPSVRDEAIRYAAKIKGHLKEVEAYRKQLKEPFLETGRRIDAAAQKHVAELALEAKRLDRLVGEFEYQQEQARKEAALALERARKEKEAQDSQPEVKPEIRASTLAAVLDAEEMAVDSTPAARGGAKRRDWTITVTDIKLLYEKHPQCVKMTPDLLSIKDLLKKDLPVAGVNAIEIHSYSAKSATTRSIQ